MNKKLILPGGLLWIAGLILTITGLNIPETTGQWLSITGNILFLLGLLLVSIAWFLQRKQDKSSQEKEGNPK